MALPQTKQYLDLLRNRSPYLSHVTSPLAVSDSVVARIRAELARLSSCHQTPPILLSRVAETFQIRRGPERVKLPGRGCIEYNNEQRCFVIALNINNRTEVSGVDRDELISVRRKTRKSLILQGVTADFKWRRSSRCRILCG